MLQNRLSGGRWAASWLLVITGTCWWSGAWAQAPTLHKHFVRGDANGDFVVNIGDPITTLDYLFANLIDSVTCLDAADFNDDESVDIADVIASLGYQFNSEPPPAAPFDACGADPSQAYALGCESYGPCDTEVDLDTAAHVLRRMGYGPTPAELQHILNIGIDAYITEQLNPELIDESGNDILNLVLSFLDPVADPLNILYLQFARATYTERQLQENLTDFWENHFSTYVIKQNQFLVMLGEDPGVAITEALNWEYVDNLVFRDEALGSFFDLLVQSATGRAMLVYLDGIFNIAGAPNENYARELLELHTMGVDNGYLQSDIEEVARCFTGWTVCKKAPADAGDAFAPCVDLTDPTGVWSFHFEPALHDYDAKLIFPNTVNEIVIPAGDPVGDPAAGINDGFIVLEQLAKFSPQTAEYISTKLIQKFVSEDVPPALLADCVVTWITTEGDLQQVVGVILNSPEFLDPDYRWNKFKTPMEHHVSFLRQTGGLSTTIPVFAGAGGLPNGLFQLNHTPFLLVTPDGYSEFGFDWLGTSSLLHRITFVNNLIHSTTDPLFDPLLLMTDAGVPAGDATAIADFWLQQAYQNNYNEAQRQIVVDYLLTDVDGFSVPLDPLAPDYEFRVRNTIGFVFSGSQFQQQ